MDEVLFSTLFEKGFHRHAYLNFTIRVFVTATKNIQSAPRTRYLPKLTKNVPLKGG